MTHEPEEPCDDCALRDLREAVAARAGIFADRGARAIVARFLLDLDGQRRHLIAEREQTALLVIGCSHCQQPAGAWCVSAGGKPYKPWGGSLAYFHTARRRDLAALTPAESTSA